ncbi:MAG: hypothetical protein ACI9SY_000222 [Candidatus Paceibacteria bacterium]|jgi:hypothetical protein
MKKIVFMCCVLLVAGFAPTAFANTTTPQSVEAAVREYFADIPVMIEIARCESKFRQFTDSGNVLRGGVGGQMIGVFQFFDRYHESAANALGFDIETLEGNLDYARHMYNSEGIAPWNSARACFDVPSQNVSSPTTVAASVHTDAILREKIALLQQIITLLQTLLAIKQVV